MKKKMLLELTNEQNDTITNLSKNKNINKTNIFRFFCNILKEFSESENINIIVYDDNKLLTACNLNNIRKLIDEKTKTLNIVLDYKENNNITTKIDVSRSEIFGG